MRGDAINGWMAIFRVVTPALLGVVLWVLTDIKTDLTVLKNDYHHELISVRERLKSIEVRLMIVNGLQ